MSECSIMGRVQDPVRARCNFFQKKKIQSRPLWVYISYKTAIQIYYYQDAEFLIVITPFLCGP